MTIKVQKTDSLNPTKKLDIIFQSWPRIEGWSFYKYSDYRCLSLSSLCWSKKHGIFILGTLTIMAVDLDRERRIDRKIKVQKTYSLEPEKGFIYVHRYYILNCRLFVLIPSNPLKIYFYQKIKSISFFRLSLLILFKRGFVHFKIFVYLVCIWGISIASQIL